MDKRLRIMGNDAYSGLSAGVTALRIKRSCEGRDEIGDSIKDEAKRKKASGKFKKL